MHISAGRNLHAQIARFHVHRVPHRGHEGRAAELAHRQAKQQVVHGGVAAKRDIGDVRWRGADGLAKIVRQRVQRGDRRRLAAPPRRPEPELRS